MGERSAIEWTDATWNPVTGCSKVSPGCAHCYAETLSLRRGWSNLAWTPNNAAENVILHADRLELPLKWRKPSRIFVNSMSDLFHEQVPAEFIDRVFAVMALAPRHVFQVLTKRPERLAQYLQPARYEAIQDAIRLLCETRAALKATTLQHPVRFPLLNVWLGVSTENQRWADQRIPLLLRTPAAVRFISAEPLLGPVDLSPYLGGLENGRRRLGLDWVITGGESGSMARPCDPKWVAVIRDQCSSAGVAFFHKQWGGRTPKAGGRQVDGRIWDELPMTAVPV
jgi:protein gp37